MQTDTQRGQLSVPELDHISRQKIVKVVSEVLSEFDEDDIRELGLGTYVLSSLRSSDTLKSVLKENMLATITNHVRASRLFMKLQKPFNFIVPVHYVPKESNTENDLLIPGSTYQISFLEIRENDVSHDEAVDYLQKSGSIFPGEALFDLIREEFQNISIPDICVSTVPKQGVTENVAIVQCVLL